MGHPGMESQMNVASNTSHLVSIALEKRQMSKHAPSWLHEVAVYTQTITSQVKVGLQTTSSV